MLSNARNKYSYEAIFVQLVICTVKDRFAGFSLSKSWFSNACAHLVPFFFLIVVFATYQESLS